jgi:hypothetical protein
MDQNISQLSSLFHQISINLDGAYRRGLDIIIITNNIRTVRGSLKFTFLDGNPPHFNHFNHFNHFSLEPIEEDGDGKSYFLLDGTTPYPLSLLEASYVQTLMESEQIPIEFIPSLYYSHNRDDFFILNVDGTTKHIFHIPFVVQYINNFDDLDYVICYSPIDSHAWCEPISQHQADVLARIFLLDVSELSTFVRH